MIPNLYARIAGLVPAIVLITVFRPAAAADLDLGSQRVLFVDDWLIQGMTDTRLVMHPPTAREVALTLTEPWEGANSAYGVVLQDGKQFRMYYRGSGNEPREYTCVAFSNDGINWTRPNLGLVACRDSKENNVFFTAEAKAFWESHNFTPFIDQNPAARPDQRYKAITVTKVPPDNHKELVAYVSRDGIHWKLLRPEPIISTGSFDSQNVAFWDIVRREYVCYLRHGRDGVRSVMRATSSDFVNWTEPQWCEFGRQPDQFYTNAITQYFREPHLYLGFPGRFVPQRKTVGPDQRQTDGVSDAVMISSHDGLHFLRPFMEAFLRPGPNPGNWGNAHINNTPLSGLLRTGPGEISMYWFENYEDVPWIRRGTVRLDGFGSVQAGFDGGQFITKPFTFKGNRLVLNFATSAVGSVRVEVQDAAGQPIDGYGLDDCVEVYGDEYDRTVKWAGGADVSKLAGQVVRLRWVLKDADVYAFQFRD